MEWQKFNGTVLNYDNFLCLIIWDACYLELLLLLTFSTGASFWYFFVLIILSKMLDTIFWSWTSYTL